MGILPRSFNFVVKKIAQLSFAWRSIFHHQSTVEVICINVPLLLKC